MNSEKLSKQIYDNEIDCESVDFLVETLSFRYRYGFITPSESYSKPQWDEIRQSQFIESLFLNIPAPSIVFIKKHGGILEIFDGVQRLEALYSSLKGNLTLGGLKTLTELNGVDYDDLELLFDESGISYQAKIRKKIIKSYVFHNVSRDLMGEYNVNGL